MLIIKYLSTGGTLQPPKDVLFTENDSVVSLRDKVFLSSPREFILPELIAILDESGRPITTKQIPEDIDTVYVDTVMNNIDLTMILENLSYIDNPKSNFFISLFTLLKQRFPALTQATLLNVLEYTIDLNVPGIILHGRAKEKLFEASTSLFKSLYNKYRIIRADLRGIDIKSYIDLKRESRSSSRTRMSSGTRSSSTSRTSNEPVFSYSIILAIIKTIIASRKLDISKIIREYPMSKKVPFMYSLEDKPIIKIHKDFPKELAKDILFKNQAPESIENKRSSGLTIKVLNSTGGYTSVYLPKYSPVLIVRCGWTRDHHISFSELTGCSSSIDTVIKTFRTILGADIQAGEKIVKFTRTQTIIKKWTTLRHLELQARSMPTIFKKDISVGKAGDGDRKNTLKLIYIPTDTTIIIKNTVVPAQANKEVNVNSIDLLGVTEEYRLQIILEHIVKLFHDTNLNYGQNTAKLVERVIKNKKIKQFRNSGIIMDPVECQKKRQPTMLRGENVVGSSQDAHTRLNYKNKTFVCQNKDYPYPGFTHGNIICCFKRDQTSKPAYIRNMQNRSSMSLFLDDKDILKTNIITTDKILDVNRLGTLNVTLQRVFNENKSSSSGSRSRSRGRTRSSSRPRVSTGSFLRLGIPQNKRSIVTALSVLLLSNIQLDPEKIDSDLFLSLEDGELQNIFTLTEYKNYLRNGPLDSAYVTDLVSRLTSTNIIIFDISNKTRILCNRSPTFRYSRYAFITKNGNVYEPIVKKVSNLELQRVFSPQDPTVKRVLSLYLKSCEIETTSTVSDTIVPWSVQELLGHGVSPISQVINSFNQITYINTKFGLLPVIPSGPIYRLPKSSLISVKLTASKQYKLLIKSKIPYVYPIGQVTTVDGDVSVGLVTASGLIVPVKKSKKVENLTVKAGQFFDDIDYVLHSEIPNFDKRYLYTLKIAFSRELFQRFRFTLANLLASDNVSRNNITNLINSNLYSQEKTKLLRNEISQALAPFVLVGNASYVYSEVPSVRNICHNSEVQCKLDPFCKGDGNNCLLYANKNDYINIVKKLALDITTSNEILSNTVRKEFLTSDNFVKRANEVILFTEKQIKDYFAE
jgi:hypothetical protein